MLEILGISFTIFVILLLACIVGYAIIQLCSNIVNKIHDSDMKSIERQRAKAQAKIIPISEHAIPVHVDVINDSAWGTNAMEMINRKLDAIQPVQPVPHIYSPSLSMRGDPRMLMGQSIGEPDAIQHRVPNFYEVVNSGLLKQNNFIFGYHNGQPLMGTWKQLYSIALAGLTGSGKSTSARFLAGQSVVNGARLLVVDPHQGSGEESLADTLNPLSPYMIGPIASNERDIVDSLRYVVDLGEKRGKDQSIPRTPIIVAVDELTQLLDRSKISGQVSKLLKDITQEHRKVGIFAMACGQIWTASSTGGTSDLRDSFASRYVHNMYRKQAGVLLPTEYAKMAEKLEAGQAILRRTNGDITIISVPNTTDVDISNITKLLPPPKDNTIESTYRLMDGNSTNSVL